MRRCHPDDVGIDIGPKADTPEAHAAAASTMQSIARYLNGFAAPRMARMPNPFTGAFICVCGKPIDGLKGSYEQDDDEGGHCGSCHVSVKFLHDVKDPLTGESIVIFQIPLIPHPDQVQRV